MGHKITNNNIIAFEMIVKIQYKDCEMTFKKTDQVHKIDVVDITKKGYIIEFSETFLAKKKVYPNLLNFLNNVVDQELDTVYQKLKVKKEFSDKIRSNNNDN
ncbi:hypothetical protein ES705_07695 [subsurface metagenome]